MSDDPLAGAALAARIDELAACSDDAGALTRLTLTPSHRAAAEIVAGWMQAAGLDVRIDGAGNVVGRRAGPAGAKTLLIGSHIDTVRRAGKYDGNLGVVVGLAALTHLRGVALPFSVELIAFSDEEGVRFRSTLTGSRAIAGNADEAALDDRDAEGVTRRAALADFGAPSGLLAAEARDPATILGFVEAHIEQGPVLEARDLPLGVVTAINGATRAEIVVSGVAGHAGTLPMTMRCDALVAAAEMVLAIEGRARSEEDLVATVGVMETPGGAVNVVPARVRFTLDLRSPSDEARLQAFAEIDAMIAAIAKERGVGAQITVTYDAPATSCSPELRARLSAALLECGVEPFHLPSGAGHDGLAFRDLWPVAMLFVRCRGGVSHNPAEYASPQDMELAARALAHFIEHLGDRS